MRLACKTLGMPEYRYGCPSYETGPLVLSDPRGTP